MKTSRKTGLFLLTGFILFLVGCGGNTPTIEPTITATEPTITAIEPTIATVVTASGLRVGDAAPDFTLPDGNGNMVRLSDELKDHKGVVLVFYYSHTWNLCINQLGGLENDRAAFEEKGTQILALAVESQADAADTSEKSKAQYPVLADAEHTVTELYGVLYPNDYALPSVFIIEQNGHIVWEYIGKDLQDRVLSSTILENLPR